MGVELGAKFGTDRGYTGVLSGGQGDAKTEESWMRDTMGEGFSDGCWCGIGKGYSMGELIGS